MRPHYHTAAATSPPPPHRRHRNRCPCGECCVRRELSTPDEVSFPAKAALAVERVVGGLRGGEGAGLRYRYRNRRRRTVDCWPSMPAAGGRMWVVPRGGAVMTADGERRGLGRRRWGGGLSYDKGRVSTEVSVGGEGEGGG